MKSDYDVIGRMDEAEIEQDRREQRMIAELVDADSTEEEIDIVAMLIDLGKSKSEIQRVMLLANEAMERGVWS